MQLLYMYRFYNSYQVFIYVQYKYSHEYLVLRLIMAILQ